MLGEWRLIRVGGMPIHHHGPHSTYIENVSITKDNIFFTYGNGHVGTITIDGDSIQILPQMSNKMIIPLMKPSAKDVASMMWSAARYKIEGNILTFYDKEGKTVVLMEKI